MKRLVAIVLAGLLSLSFLSSGGKKPRTYRPPAQTLTSNILTATAAAGSGIEHFEGTFPPAGWTLINPNVGTYTFEHFSGTNGPALAGNKCVKMDFYNYSNSGQRDTLKTTVFEAQPNDTIRFDWAYCQYPGYSDRLQVIMSTNGGATFTQIIFDKSGAALATVPSSSNAFVPSDTSHWDRYGYAFSGLSNVAFAFVTTNAYGNNLYIDNVTVGAIPMDDVAPIGFSNILADTSYRMGTITPKVLFGNFGANAIASSFNVTMTIEPGGYTSSRSIPSLYVGQSTELSFDDYVVSTGTPIVLTAYTSYGTDSHLENDTIRQNSVFLDGFEKMVLFEEWTSSTCGPCAANNPTIDAFMASHDEHVVPIKYHVGWPSPGNDPMYLHNPTQSYDRRYYYGVNAVPTLIMEGTLDEIPPNANECLLANLKGSPVGVSVVNTRPTQDSIHAVVTVDITSPLPAGNYYLRVHAVEKHIHYASPPGTNGETDFYDVFRRAYPGSQGTVVTNAVGTYTFEFTYYINPVWVDSQIYTAAFIQNDVNKKIVNAGKSETTQYIVDVVNAPSPRHFALHQNYPNPFNPSTTIRYELPADARVTLKIYNTLGQIVRTLVDTRQSAGFQQTAWDGLDERGLRVGSGMYLYRLEAGGKVQARKMLMLK